MATIRTAGGKIVTKEGKPSCACCDCTCPEYWGPGYDTLPSTISARIVSDLGDEEIGTADRIGSCLWSGSFDLSKVLHSSPCIWWLGWRFMYAGKQGASPIGSYFMDDGAGVQFRVDVT